MIAHYHLDGKADKLDYMLLKEVTRFYQLPAGLVAGHKSGAILKIAFDAAEDAEWFAELLEARQVPFSLWYIL